MGNDVSANRFGVLAILAFLFACVSVGVVYQLQDQMDEPMECDDCEYLLDGKCVSHECCEDMDCSETEICLGHACSELDCEANEEAVDHGCALIQNQTENKTNQSLFECENNLDCNKTEECVNGSCIELECDRFEIVTNHTCKEVECVKDDQCNKSSFCLNNQCKKLSCGECQYLENNSCIDYECCVYTDCEGEQACENNKCVELNCSEGTYFLAGACVKYTCTKDSDCNDKESETTDTCIDANTTRAKCVNRWDEKTFTGNKTITLHLNQSAYYKEKRSRVTLLTLKDEYGYFWTDQAKLRYSINRYYTESWVEIPSSDLNATAKKTYWGNVTRDGERLSIIMKSIDEKKQTAKMELLYTRVD